MLVAGSPALALKIRLISTPCGLRMIATSSPSARRDNVKPEHTVETEGAVEVAHPDGDMGDTLNSDRLSHSHLYQLKAPLKRPLRRSSQEPRRNDRAEKLRGIEQLVVVLLSS
jgi:hypothetical protein